MDKEGKVAVARLSRARVEIVGADGILISGFEEIGQDKTGKPKFRYQEWWLRYASNNETIKKQPIKRQTIWHH
jgi:hypothetical protein